MNAAANTPPSSAHSASRTKVIVVVHGLQAGGTERVSIALTRWIHQRESEFSVALLTFDAPDSDFYDATDLPRLTAWPEGRPPKARLRRIGRVRKILREEHPDLVVAMGTFAAVTTLASSIGSPWKVIVSERNDPSKVVSRPLSVGRRMLYRHAFAGVAQTDHASAWLRSLMPSRHVYIVPNAVDTEHFTGPRSSTTTRPRSILSVGRLHRQKGHDVLIKAFALLPQELREQWHLRIVGEGVERARLEALVRSLGCTEHVTLPGTTQDILSEYHQADVFAMASRYEGFPNALLEAMATGLPVVASNIPPMRAILCESDAGILFPVGSPEGASQALLEMIANKDRRREAGFNGAELVKGYSEGAVYGQWFHLLCRALDTPKRRSLDGRDAST